MPQPDYYAVLGIPETASPEQIKKAYRKLARKYHPDAGGPEASDTKFMEAKEAYEALSDRARRAAYDTETQAPSSSNGAGPETPPAPDKSEWTPDEWKAYWQFGGKDLPDEWTDALRQAHRECPRAPFIHPFHHPAAPPTPSVAEKARASATVSFTIPQPLALLISLALLGLGIYLFSDLRHFSTVAEYISGIHPGTEHSISEGGGFGHLVMILLGVVFAIGGFIVFPIAIAVVLIGFGAMTLFAGTGLFTKTTEVAIVAGAAAATALVAGSLYLRLIYFLIYS